MTSKERLEQYIKEDSIYQNCLDNHKSYVSDFDRFCIEHCQDIKNMLKENESLKKQLEEKTRIAGLDHKYASKFEDKVITMENQQKEFIKYLEKEINMYKNLIQTSLKGFKIFYFLINNLQISKKKLEETLAKYKEIIGGENE